MKTTENTANLENKFTTDIFETSSIHNGTYFTNTVSYHGTNTETTPTLDWCATYEFVDAVLVSGIISLLGIVGNTLAQYVLWPEVMVNPTSFLLIVLGLADNLLLSIHYIVRGSSVICEYLQIGHTFMRFVYPAVSVYGWPFAHVFQTTAAWIIVLLSFCRYIALVKPHDINKYTSIGKIRIAALAVFLFNLLYYMPNILARRVVMKPDGTGLDRITLAYSDTVAYTLYNVPLYYILMYIIPIFLLSFMTYFQTRALKEIKLRRMHLTMSKKNEHEITKTLIVVVIVFIVCQVWEPVRRLFTAVLPGDNGACNHFIYQSASMKAFFTMLNAAIDFPIYYFCGSKFRRMFELRVLRRGLITPASTAFHTMSSSHT